ncbi:MAG: prepilin-type N-terminal cleavage/methylation domain-containing protein [Methylococcales bacterium]|nr:prepilin-type N-terminal cleavage/methylation domain-containing protein [Methylococcales bacterium]
MQAVHIKSSQGFTLIEVLIALSLLSVMMLMLFAGLRISAKSWDKGENKLTEVAEMSSTAHFFHNQLAASLPLWDDFTTKIKEFSFQGTQNTLQFVSSLPASSRRLGLQRFNVRLKNTKIEVSIQPFYPTLADDAWKIETVTLVDNIGSLTLRYFGSKEPKELPVWQTNWHYDHLPKLIAITIQPLNEHYWPQTLLKLNNEEAPKKALNVFEKALKRSKQNGNSPSEKNTPFTKRRGLNTGFMGLDPLNYYGGQLYFRDA